MNVAFIKRSVVAVAVSGAILLAGCSDDADDRSKGSLESKAAEQSVTTTPNPCAKLKGAKKVKCARRLAQQGAAP